MHKLSPIDYKKRTDHALDLISGSALLVLAMPEATRNSDVNHAYRTESFLHYLTGFDEPETALLLINHPTAGRKKIAFVRRRDPLAELWTGRRLGVEEAVSALKVDEAFGWDELWDQVPHQIKGVEKIFYTLGRDKYADADFVDALWNEKRLRGRHSFSARIPVYDADRISGAMRLIKGPEELERMRMAADITKKAFDVVLQSVRPGMNERQVHGMLVGEFMKGGAEMEAYTSIVAGGANACCLHYHANNAELFDKTLLLIDAGSQFQYYASDVTRTFPVGKSFTPEQKAVYDVVLEVQLKGIAMSRLGGTMQAIHDETCKAISRGLVDLGLLKGNPEEIFESKAFRKYYPHGTGHWLGMDVHDAGDYVESDIAMPLKPGMVFTVEPGLYIEPKDESVPAGFRGIGIRIEDDIVITKGEPEILTAGIPKQSKVLENRY